MFNDIGKKIKKLAQILCWVGIVVSVIAALMMFVAAGDTYSYSKEESYKTLGLIWLFVGPLSSWISSLFTYGFGEIIDKLTRIEINTRSGDRISEVQNEAETKRINELEKLRSQGLITEEEYQKAVAKEL